ncbi:MAG: ATP-binding protein [Holophagaceae bacterium]|nr:ATP-binding protein [Holophagaceae bacterium]
MSMRIKATLIIFLVMVTIRLIGSFSDLSFTTKSLVETIKNEQILEQSLANELASAKIDLLISNAEAVASQLSLVKAVNSRSSVMKSLLQKFPEFTAFTIFNREGLEATFGLDPAEKEMLFATGHNLSAAFAGKGTITTTQYNQTSNTLVLYICVPMEGDRALVATMPARVFSDYFSGHRIWKTGSIYIIDGEGTLVVHYDQRRVQTRDNPIELSKTDPSYKSTGEFFQKMLLTKEGSGTYMLDGTSKLCSYKYLSSERVDWILGVVAPFNESPLAKLRWGLVTSSLAIFAVGAIAAYIISGFIIRPYNKLKELNKTVLSQAARIEDEHSRAMLMLDSTPLSNFVFDKNHRIIECNEAALKLFKVNSKQEFFDRFFEFSPEFQPNGRPSRETANYNIQKAFEDGKYEFTWVHMLAEGTLVPSEISLVRVPYEDDFAVVGYARDLREHERMMQAIQHRDKLLRAGQEVAALLLTTTAISYESFESTLLESMKLIGTAVDADRVQIWKNEMVGGHLHFVLEFTWLSEVGWQKTHLPKGLKFPYKDKPSWEKRFLRGGHINSPLSVLAKDDQEFLSAYDIKSVVIIPLFMQDKFWGFFSLDDCREERVFSDDDINILRSVGLMYTSAMNRDAQSAMISEALNRTRQLLDQMPFGCDLWDENYNLFDANDAAARLFKMDDKQDYINQFGKMSPEYQPDGQLSSDFTHDQLNKAFEEGKCVFEWTHRLLDGTLLPMEITLVRYRFGDDYVVAAYKQDLTKYKQITAELEKALTDAKNANIAKSRFLANMSHEMRTPLNAVLGLSELAMETEGLNNDVFTGLEKIYGAGSTLLSTVNDILDISKIEAGKFEILADEYDVPSLINDTVTQNILRIGEKPIRFLLEITSDLPARLYGDELRIKQVFNNLLSNALKYTKEGAVELSIKSERVGDTVWITAGVRDTGIGIKPEDLNLLFDDYAQLDMKSNYRVEGTGLGLSITKAILDLMDGTISVKSEYGTGSLFTVKFRQGFVNDDIIGDQTVENLLTFHYTNDKRGQHMRFVRANLSYARVLVVDDIVTNLDVAKGLMKPYEMQIDCISSGEEAVEAIRREEVKYNAIFMDHMMPGMDGIEATRIIREEIGTEYAKTVPIIALTANAVVGNEKMFLENGFQAFLPKPIDISRLDEVINHWVRDKHDLTHHSHHQTNDGTGQDNHSDHHIDRRGGIDRRIFGQHIPSLDAHEGIDRFGGISPYTEILHSYATTTKPILESISEIDPENLTQYITLVHGIKGSSRGIGAHDLGEQAATLEAAARDGDFQFISNNNKHFVETAKKLIHDIEKLLTEIASHDHRPQKDKPDNETLAKLLTACKEFDMDQVDMLMTEIDSYEYESDDGLVAWLKENVSLANFSQICNKLQTLV